MRHRGGYPAARSGFVKTPVLHGVILRFDAGTDHVS